MQEKSLTCPDGVTVNARFYPSEAPACVLVLGPALGVTQKFYAEFASRWAHAGIEVLSIDYRGCGDSRDAAQAESCVPATWGQQDIEAALQWSRHHRPDLPQVFLGHSMGGQLLGLAPSATQLDAVVFVAATEPSAGVYPLREALWFSLVWRALIPAATLGRKQCPLGGLNAPSAAVRQWAKWCTTSDYLFGDLPSELTAGYSQIQSPLLSLGFSDDSYAPQSAIQPLLDRYSAAGIESRKISPRQLETRQIGHFGWFRDKIGGTSWQEVRDWIAAVSRPSAQGG